MEDLFRELFEMVNGTGELLFEKNSAFYRISLDVASQLETDEMLAFSCVALLICNMSDGIYFHVTPTTGPHIKFSHAEKQKVIDKLIKVINILGEK